jgi:hypothetical protein
MLAGLTASPAQINIAINDNLGTGASSWEVRILSLREVHKPASACRIIIVIRYDNLPFDYRSISLTRFPAMLRM